MKKLFTRYTPLQIIMHIGVWIPLLLLVLDFATGNLSPNPIQDLEQHTGRAAITLLIISLACTPLNTIFNWHEPLKRRRTLGLYAFMYAAIHALIFVDLDYGLAWSLIVQTIVQKPRLIAGILAFLLLILLALTSFDIWKVRLGKNWKRLHQVIYFITPLVVLHYAWSKKGDLFALQGDIIKPLIYGLVLLLLLTFRIKPIRKALVSLRGRILPALSRRNPQTHA
jgi:sulfoxide reductase heme-binding subunit YedZ